tara:strand:+ start:631 stop:1182 length:552 start_codon:yes stop_codon:yes gene_type:complete
MNTDNEEIIIEKIERLAFLLAAGDGISEDEGFELETFAGKMRAWLPFKKAVQEFENSSDLTKAMKHVEGPPIHAHIMTFGLPEHVQDVADELKKIIDSDDSVNEYHAYIKLLAYEITDDFEQKISMCCIEDVLLADGISSIERTSLTILGRCWGVSAKGATRWFNEYFVPIIEEANKLEPSYD